MRSVTVLLLALLSLPAFGAQSSSDACGGSVQASANPDDTLNGDNTFTIAWWSWWDGTTFNNVSAAALYGGSGVGLLLRPHDQLPSSGFQVFHTASVLWDGNNDRTGWRHYVFRSNGATAHTGWVDGVHTYSSGTNVSLENPVTALLVGEGSSGGCSPDALIAHFSVYDRALTDAEILTLAKSCTVLAGALHYYPMMQPTGISSYDAGTGNADLATGGGNIVTSASGPRVQECGGGGGL